VNPVCKGQDIERRPLSWKSFLNQTSTGCHWSMNALLILADAFLIYRFWNMPPSHDVMLMFAFFCWHLGQNLEMLICKGAAQ
jgi:hypothetical protein